MATTKTHSRFDNSRSLVSEAALRRIIKEELVREYLIREGIFDDVKGGLKKLSAAISKKFGDQVAKWAKSLKQIIDTFSRVPDEVKEWIGFLKHGMSESGKQFKLDDRLKAAKQLGTMNKDSAMAMVEKDLAGPVKEFAASMQKSKTSESSYALSAYLVISEADQLESFEPPLLVINEVLGAAFAVGSVAAVMGAAPYVLKGIAKLFKVVHAESTAEFIEHAAHVCEEFEEDVVEGIFPSELLWAVYKKLPEQYKSKASKEEIKDFEEFQGTHEGKEARRYISRHLYTMLLIFLCASGLSAAAHAGASALGFFEGGTSAFKAFEIGKVGVGLAKAISSV